jgi:hypothetical protein
MTPAERDRIRAAAQREASKLPPLSLEAAARVAAIVAPALAALDEKQQVSGA